MTVPFTNLPSNIRVPLFYAEVDNSQANSGGINQRTLIIGQMTSAGTATGNIPEISAGVGDAQTKYGVNSMLATMLAAYRAADTFGEVWCLPVADDGAAAAATGTITVSGTATAGGTLALYVGGKRYQVPVLSGQTAAQVAATINATINADPYSLVSSAVAAAVVTLTAVNKGIAGNSIDLRLNYGGSVAGEYTPVGVTCTIVQMSGGTVNPTLTTALLNCGDQPFDFIVCPYNDSTTLDALKGFLADQSGRWAWSQMLYGHYFAVKTGTLGALTTFGLTRNDQHGTVLGVNGSPTPDFVIAAQLTGSIAGSLRNDPGRPVQTLPIIGMQPPAADKAFKLSERNTLLYDGISTFSIGQDGTCYAENIITTYQKNPYGNPDSSYLEVETMFELAYCLRFMKTRITSRYGRVKLANDGTRFGAGAAIVTPSILKADVIAAYQELEEGGHVQDSAAFAKTVIVERNASNPNRVDILWPGHLINQFRIGALLAQFRV